MHTGHLYKYTRGISNSWFDNFKIIIAQFNIETTEQIGIVKFDIKAFTLIVATDKSNNLADLGSFGHIKQKLLSKVRRRALVIL